MPGVFTWLHLLAATSSVLVVALALTRHANPAFRAPLVALGVDQFIWNAASLASGLTSDARYSWLGAVVTPVFGALLLHYALVFTGRIGRFRRLLGTAYVVYALEAAVVVLDWALGDGRLGLPVHSLVATCTGAPLLLFGAWLIRQHLREVVSEAERQRTWLFVVVLVVGVPLLLTDLLHDVGLDVPQLATAGSAVINGTFITIALGISGVSRRQQLGQAVLFALLVVVAFLSVFSALKDHQGLLVLAVASLTLGLIGAGGALWRVLSRRQQGLERFATLGRFSAQMAHDLKNPLAAARGAAELLEGEVKALGKDELSHFSSLLVQQLDRLTAIIDRYQRLSRMELERQELDLNELVSKVLSLQAFAAGEVSLKTALAPVLPRLSLDPELLSSALENLVKNAFEATPPGGSVTVATALGERSVRLAVRDTGQGMDPRTREQVFALFFTTKAQGSGLGLAFVQQIVRAHGGEVFLDSREGHGTTVELVFPLATNAQGS